MNLNQYEPVYQDLEKKLFERDKECSIWESKEIPKPLELPYPLNQLDWGFYECDFKKVLSPLDLPLFAALVDYPFDLQKVFGNEIMESIQLYYYFGISRENNELYIPLMARYKQLPALTDNHVFYLEKFEENIWVFCSSPLTVRVAKLLMDYYSVNIELYYYETWPLEEPLLNFCKFPSTSKEYIVQQRKLREKKLQITKMQSKTPFPYI